MTRSTGTKEERRSYKKIFNSSSQIDEENLEREGDEPAEESVEEADEDKTDGDKEADWTEESDDPEDGVQSRGDDLFGCVVEHPRDLEKIKLVLVPSFLQAYKKIIFQWRAAVQKHTLLSLCHKDNVRKEEKEEGDGEKEELPGPLTKYVPQEEIVLESNLEVAAFTKLVHKKIYIIYDAYKQIECFRNIQVSEFHNGHLSLLPRR